MLLSEQIFFLYFFISVLRPFQDYCSSYETAQSVGGRKWENPEKNYLANPQAELGLSHMWPERGSQSKYNINCSFINLKLSQILVVVKINKLHAVPIYFRGVVQLFNAVRKQQKTVEGELEMAGSDRKKEKVMEKMTKHKFLNMLKGTSDIEVEKKESKEKVIN